MIPMFGTLCFRFVADLYILVLAAFGRIRDDQKRSGKLR